MHHFIYPVKDTYISSKYPDKNFGIDEILQVGTRNFPKRTWKTTKSYSYDDAAFSWYQATSFTGEFVGSVSGSHVSGSVSGSFSGSLESFQGVFNGTGSGNDVRNQSYWTTETIQEVDRSLIKFDITEISKSISDGSINSPKFKLKMKVCEESDLPISYNIYALPVSQSWNMGNGYLSDGGSNQGTSWDYTDNNNGNRWYSSQLSQSAHTLVDFVNNPNLATASFAYGGGTWYSGSSDYIASQSFDYQVGDINMDVTNLAMLWVSSSIPNEGILLLHSDEFEGSGSGFVIKFFSRDTNTIYSPYLDVMWEDSVIITGSFGTGSIDSMSVPSGISASISSNSTFSINGGVSGSFSGSITYVLDANTSASGFISANGYNGNVLGCPIFGVVSGSIGSELLQVTSSFGNVIESYPITASLMDGPFSGSNFNGYYKNNTLIDCFLSGSWSQESIQNGNVTIPIPSQFPPYCYAQILTDYLSGSALGTYSVLNSTSASFFGQFIDGITVGGNLSIQLTGSVVTQSYVSSDIVNITSSVLTQLDTDRPYSIVINSLRPMYKYGDVIKIGLFAREQFGLKTFEKSSQQSQYLIPKYLPTSSYYAVKDNETGEIVMDFDTYTQLSCEFPKGNYFRLDTTSIQPERFYRILIRVEDVNGSNTIDTGKVFKLVR